MVNPKTNRESSPAAFLVIALFILVPPLGILAAIVLAVYSKAKKSSASGSRPPRTETAPPSHPGYTAASPEKDRHGHTPQTYSYDSCATERRLEQLEALKNAGLMEQEEYLRFRDKITNGA